MRLSTLLLIWSTTDAPVGVHVPVRSHEQKKEVVRLWYPSCLQQQGERPAHTKGSLTPLQCLLLVITSTTIESMGQGEARTLVRGGCLRSNKQMFFDDNCREGKRSVEGRLVKHSLVEAVPPASCPLWSPVVVCCLAPGVRVGLLVPLPLLAGGNICSQ